MELSGLPGLSKSVEAGGFSTVAGAMRCLRDNGAGTAAGDCGAINVWIDDRGYPRGEFMRYMSTKSRYEGGTKEGLQQWLKTWIPELEGRHE